jgi:hypothetical protein
MSENKTKRIDSIHLVEAWLIMISLLGGILFAISYFEDQQESKEKQELDKTILELQNQTKTLNYYTTALINSTLRQQLFNQDVVTWHDSVENRINILNKTGGRG